MKKLVVICLGLILLQSCDNTGLAIFNTVFCGCNEEEIALYEAVERGDLGALRAYLEGGGEPTLKCYADVGRSDGFWDYLYYKVALSNSTEMVKYYIGFNLPQKIKDDLLGAFVNKQNTELTRLLVDSDAHRFRNADGCLQSYYEEILKEYELLVDVGYDFNWQNDDGNTLLMLYSKCWADDSSEKLITILQFLVDHGAKTDIKNNDGKTAYDVAVNPKVKAFLAQYE